MLEVLGYASLDALCEAAIPAAIRLKRPLDLPEAVDEHKALAELSALCSQNQVRKSLIGMGYAGTLTPPVIQRNILENPGWYTQYTPYQAEISQGRLEAMLNFQTMVVELTAMDIANASLLDEATAAAEAMSMCLRLSKKKTAEEFLVSSGCHPQTIEVLRTRAEPLGIKVVVGEPAAFEVGAQTFGALVQTPDTLGGLHDFSALAEELHGAGAMLVVATDILSLALLKPPGEMGADVVIGTTQRFGVPLGYGGPHAAFFAARDAAKRAMPGRVVGVSMDAAGRPAYRLALQTREQHIRRDKATSNICTAQVLLAVIASMYACYHGPDGLRAIATRINRLASRVGRALESAGWRLVHHHFFDTLVVEGDAARVAQVHEAASARNLNFRQVSPTRVGITLDETVDCASDILACFGASCPDGGLDSIPDSLRRTSPPLRHPIFSRHCSETQMLRYIRRLESRDLSLTTSMIPLGSCTMKLNATAEMQPISWPGFAQIHPFAPDEQTVGYRTMISQLEQWLCEITGFAAVSLQPNAGSQGEYAGLLAIRGYHEANGQPHRNVCLIPTSAHGTNPASAVMAGMKVVPVACDADGNVDIADLEAKVDAHRDALAALMVTYPSTHGVFEETITRLCDIIHQAGGQVYMDGANMNAQVALCRPGDFGPDVCHLNLHKTFCIPHGGGGPGVGPVCVAAHLAPYLPGWVGLDGTRSKSPLGPVSATRYGSAGILPIPWLYIRAMGADGLRLATQTAILNANYMAHRLQDAFPILYRGKSGLVAHECIIDCRPLEEQSGITVEDIAKRLMDYGFHAPTMSWPVAGTLMIEPTESEDKAELDRFCDALLSIHAEAMAVASGAMHATDNPLKHAPHTAQDVCSDAWQRTYPRELAAYPAPWTREHKFWPHVSRIDSVYGDRNLVCTCPSVEELAGA